ncbi:MAG: aminotransferase class I/II-fold pyridoxal phosphate-dependent enzyme [Pseudomonadota bacterium]
MSRSDSLHDWDPATELLATSVIGKTVERLKLQKDPTWGAANATELNTLLEDSVTSGGIGGIEALALYAEKVLPACRPIDHPTNFSYIPSAPSNAATMIDLLVSASAVMGAMWETGAGAIALENRALRWLAELVGMPPESAGCFVSGGSAANLSALVSARHAFREAKPNMAEERLVILISEETHACVGASARIMDCDLIAVPSNAQAQMTVEALAETLEGLPQSKQDRVFALVTTLGTTNAGAIDHIPALCAFARERGWWTHIDGAYGGAALAVPEIREYVGDLSAVDSFCVDPHKWLFVPYDSAALLYRDPAVAARAHAQHGAYLDAVDRSQFNPSDLAFHLSRRTRGVSLWFNLATYGTDAMTAAVRYSIDQAKAFAERVKASPKLELLMPPELSVVMFTVEGWTSTDYDAWSKQHSDAGEYLVIPTTWRNAPCLRVALMHPKTAFSTLESLLVDLEITARPG